MKDLHDNGARNFSFSMGFFYLSLEISGQFVVALDQSAVHLFFSRSPDEAAAGHAAVLCRKCIMGRAHSKKEPREMVNPQSLPEARQMHNTLQRENVDAFDALYKFNLTLYRFLFCVIIHFRCWYQPPLDSTLGGRCRIMWITFLHR